MVRLPRKMRLETRSLHVTKSIESTQGLACALTTPVLFNLITQEAQTIRKRCRFYFRRNIPGLHETVHKRYSFKNGWDIRQSITGIIIIWAPNTQESNRESPHTYDVGRYHRYLITSSKSIILIHFLNACEPILSNVSRALKKYIVRVHFDRVIKYHWFP